MPDVRPTQTRAVTPAEAKAVQDAEETGVPFLHWRTADGTQQISLLEPTAPRISVGRKPESDIPLTWDAEISRTHALIERVGGRWVIVDDGMSTNGSFVNGSRVVGRQSLHDQDRLCFGQTILIYREPTDREKSESTVRAPTPTVLLSETQRKVLIALCRPVNESQFATPATNKQIADELFLSVDAVKAHLRLLFERFELDELPQNEKRARLAARALTEGVLSRHEF
jgi:pSer/pThr/pTyr-binding forkhead associated (FHA) protein